MNNHDSGSNPDFREADAAIRELLEQLRADDLCGCCVGRALFVHAMAFVQMNYGPREAAELLQGLEQRQRERLSAQMH